MQHDTASNKFQNLVLAVFFAIMVGWILVIGQSLLLPIFSAVISVYILVTASDHLGATRLGSHMNEGIRRFIVLIGFIVVIVALGGVVIATADQMSGVAPKYQANLEKIVAEVSKLIGIEKSPDWQAIQKATIGKLDLSAMVGSILGSAMSLVSSIFVILIYATFLLAERGGFARKLSVALPGESAKQTHDMVNEINAKIGSYLSVKTLINVILAVLSFIIMWAMGVDFALFWALMIGLLNYIPYVGSMLGVVFPVLLTLAQFGSITTTLIVAVLLAACQAFVGNILEPKMVGRKVNLSPFVVLAALSVWSSFWGIPGAILAIPLTSIVAIVLGGFQETRFLAILLADDVSAYETDKGA